MNGTEDFNIIVAELPNSKNTSIEQETSEYINSYPSLTTQQLEVTIEDNENDTEEPTKFLHCFVKQEIYEDDNNYDLLSVKQEELAIKDENQDLFRLSLDQINNSNLNSNPESQVSEKLFFCSFCDYKTNKERYLVDHRHIHKELVPFTCNLCNYTSKKRSNLTRHMGTHTREKPFNCCICNHKSADKTSFSLHLKTHTGEKPFSCTMCHYKCIIKGDLVRHLRVHTGEKPYECHLCDYKCTAKGHLNRHVKGHAKKRLFICELCDYKCVYEGYLNNHIVKKHSGKINNGKSLKKSDSRCYFKNNCVTLKEESYWFDENGEVDSDLQKQIENDQNLNGELVIKKESVWED